MACFLVPLTEAVVTSVASGVIKAGEKKVFMDLPKDEKTPETGENISISADEERILFLK